MILSTLSLSWRELRRHRLRSFLTTLGVVVGVASVVSLVTLGRGATARVDSEVNGLGSNLLIISPKAPSFGSSSTGQRPLDLGDAEALQQRLPSLAALAPTQSVQRELILGSKSWNTLVVGTTPAYLSIRGYELKRGDSLPTNSARSSSPVCLLGAAVERQMRERGVAEDRIRVGGVSCEVIGALASKGQSGLGDDPDNVILMPLGTVRQRLVGNGDLHAILASARPDRSPAAVKRGAEEILRERHRLTEGRDDDFTVQDMQELLSAVTAMTSALSALLGAIASVSLIVGGIGIMNIMLVSVSERTNEIGMRLAIGATEADVLLQFLAEAVVLSLTGGVLGLLFGTSSAWVACRALDLPFVLRADVVLAAFGVSAGVGLVFGLLPARRAARLEPVEALRHL